MSMQGDINTQYQQYPSNISLSYLRGLQNAAGVSFARLHEIIEDMMGAFDSTQDPWLLTLMAPPTTAAVVDSAGTPRKPVRRSPEYTTVEPTRITPPQKHLLPIDEWSNSTQLTKKGLRKMSEGAIVREIEAALNGHRAWQRQRTLQRLTDGSEWRVETEDTLGYSPGFAGSGVGGNAFNQPYPSGQALPAGYTHYITDVAANRPAAIRLARTRIRRWHPAGRIEIATTQAQIDALIAQDPNNFVLAGSALVRPGANEREALVDPDTHVGVYMGDILVRKAVEDWNDPHIVVYYTGGRLAADNPLVWRYDENVGRPAYLETQGIYPLDQSIVEQVFDIGVNNRVAACNIRIVAAAGDPYVAPAIS